MGTATVRRRRLPADQVLWLVVGMALLRNESIERVAAMLNLALPTGTRGDAVAKSALSQARRRLGEEPLAYKPPTACVLEAPTRWCAFLP